MVIRFPQGFRETYKTLKPRKLEKAQGRADVSPASEGKRRMESLYSGNKEVCVFNKKTM